MDDIERAIDELYAGPPEAFTSAREALAKELKAGGDDAATRRVRSLRKPVRTAWAVNRLVREHIAEVEELIGAGERLRAAQRRALSGGAADELRERSDERRRLVAALTQRAAQLLGDDEPPASVVEDIAATLEAASVDEEATAALLEGRLTKPLPRPAGFGDAVGFRMVPGGRDEAPGPSAAEERAERRKHERELRAAEERARKATEHVQRLRGELEEIRSREATLRERLRAAEAESRGAALEARRLRR